MNHLRTGLLLTALSLFVGCAVVQQECEARVHTERERCLRANASSREAVETRAAGKQKPGFEPPAEETKRESTNDKWIP
jgi:hypothetical protein